MPATVNLLRNIQLVASSERTLTVFVGVVALRYQHPPPLLTSECHNSQKHTTVCNNCNKIVD